MESPTGSVSALAIETSIGPAHIANLVLSALFGIALLQTYTYFQRVTETQDGVLLKSLVAILWIVDTLHFSVVSSAHYHYAITNYNNSASLLRLTWRSSIIVLLTAMNDLIVRGIFIFRIRMLGGKHIVLVTALWLGCLTNFCASVAFASQTAPLQHFMDYDMHSWIVYIALVSAALVDLVIAAAQYTLLKRHRRESSRSRRFQETLRSLMLYSINTGALSCICASCCLLTYVTMRWNHIYDFFYWVMPSLYFNALLATLNARKRLRQSLEGQVVSFPMIDIASTLSVPPQAAATRPSRITLPRLGEAAELPWTPLSGLSASSLSSSFVDTDAAAGTVCSVKSDSTQGRKGDIF